MDISKIQSEVLSKIDTSKLPIDDLEGMASKLQGAIGSLPDILGSMNLPVDIGDILGDIDVSEIADTFKNPLEMFKNKLPTTDQLSSIAPEIEKGLKEAKSKLETLATDAAEAISEPVSFITKPISDVVQGIDSKAITAAIDKPLDGLDDAISNISKSIGSAIGSTGQLSSAINSITSELSSSLGSFSLSDITSDLGIDSFIGNIESAISGVEDIIGVVDDVSSTLNDALESLPDELKGLVNLDGIDNIGGTLDKLVGDKLDIVTNITKQLDGNISGEDILNMVFGSIGSSSDYPQITDSNGNDATSSYGDHDKSTIDSIYALAQQVCPDIESPDLSSFAVDKSIFDALLKMSIELNFPDLLSKLTACSESNSNLYDDNSTKTLRESTYNVAMQGNAVTYSNIQDIIGTHNYTDPSTEMLVLAANMSGTDANVAAYNRSLVNFGLNTKDLMTDDVEGHTVYDAAKVTIMSSTDTRIVDQLVGDVDRSLMYTLLAS